MLSPIFRPRAAGDVLVQRDQGRAGIIRRPTRLPLVMVVPGGGVAA